MSNLKVTIEMLKKEIKLDKKYQEAVKTLELLIAIIEDAKKNKTVKDTKNLLKDNCLDYILYMIYCIYNNKSFEKQIHKRIEEMKKTIFKNGKIECANMQEVFASCLATNSSLIVKAYFTQESYKEMFNKATTKKEKEMADRICKALEIGIEEIKKDYRYKLQMLNAIS